MASPKEGPVMHILPRDPTLLIEQRSALMSRRLQLALYVHCVAGRTEGRAIRPQIEEMGKRSMGDLEHIMF